MRDIDRPNPIRCVSDLVLDRWVAGELAESERRSVRDHVDLCARCRDRLDAIVEELRRFQEAPPPVRLATAPGHALLGRWYVALGASIAAAACLVFFAVKPRLPSIGAPTERTKGSGDFGYYVMRDGLVFDGEPGHALHPGDSIQLVYSTRTPTYLGVLSLDGEHKASIYYPATPRAARVEPGRRQALPQSTILDETLGDETLYAVSCNAPIALEPLRAELAAHPETAPRADGCRVSTLSFRKERR